MPPPTIATSGDPAFALTDRRLFVEHGSNRRGMDRAVRSRARPARAGGIRGAKPCSSWRPSPRTPPSAGRPPSRAGWRRLAGCPLDEARALAEGAQRSRAAARASASGSLIPSSACGPPAGVDLDGIELGQHLAQRRLALEAGAQDRQRRALVARRGTPRRLGRPRQRRAPRASRSAPRGRTACRRRARPRPAGAERSSAATTPASGCERLLGLRPHRHVERRERRAGLRHDDGLEAGLEGGGERPRHERPATELDQCLRECPSGASARRRGQPRSPARLRPPRSRQRHRDLARLPSARPRERQLELAARRDRPATAAQ